MAAAQYLAFKVASLEAGRSGCQLETSSIIIGIVFRSFEPLECCVLVQSIFSTSLVCCPLPWGAESSYLIFAVILDQGLPTLKLRLQDLEMREVSQ